MANFLDLIKVIESSKKIAIFAHSMPDADAFCSSLALKELIKNNFSNSKKRIDIYIPMSDGVPALYQPIVGNEVFNKFKYKYSKHDLAIALDSPNTNRFSEFSYIFKKARKTANIDHHESNVSFAKDFNFVSPKASSVCEMIYGFAKSSGLKINDTIAKHIYTGIITDTNCLTSSSVSKTTYKTLIDLSKYNFEQESIKNYFFKSNTKAKTFMLEKALRSLRFYGDDQVAIMQITCKDIEKYEAQIEDTLGIVDHANNIEGVKIAAILIEKEEQNINVSLRSKGEINVAEIAQHFDGGGHSTMAGFSYTGEISELKSKLVSLCKKAVSSLDETEE